MWFFRAPGFGSFPLCKSKSAPGFLFAAYWHIFCLARTLAHLVQCPLVSLIPDWLPWDTLTRLQRDFKSALATLHSLISRILFLSKVPSASSFRTILCSIIPMHDRHALRQNKVVNDRCQPGAGFEHYHKIAVKRSLTPLAGTTSLSGYDLL